MAQGNRIYVNTATAGTGTVTLGAVRSAQFCTFAEAGIADGATIRSYIIEEGTDFEIGIGVYNSAGPTLTRATVLSSRIGGIAGTTKMTLAGAATVRCIAAKEDILSPFNNLSDVNDVVTSRTNLSAAHIAAMAAHNVAVNGAVNVSQELGTTGATLTNNTAKYIADQWEAMYNHGAATAVVTSAQLAAASFGAVLAGFQFGHQIKATTAITSPANGDFAKHRQKIEGYRIAPWGWGATGASAIVIAFELYSTGTGTAFVKLSNSDQSRCYYHEITVAAGWNFYAFTVAGDTSGTWQATTSTGLTFEVFVSGKETTPASSLDAWGSTNKVQTTNSTNLLGTNNNLTVLTGLYVNAGTQLPVAADLPLLMRLHPETLVLCQRYYQKSYQYGDAPATITNGGTERFSANGTAHAGSVPLVPVMRTGGTLTFYNPNSGATGSWRDASAGADRTVAVSTQSDRNFSYVLTSSVGANLMLGQWIMDARL